MALSPEDKFIYVNPDTTSGEYNAAQFFPVKYLRGLECIGATQFYIYFRGPKNAVSTRLTVLITSGKVKEFFTQFVDEVNFGEDSVITLADRNVAIDTTTGGTDFVHVNASTAAVIMTDSTTSGFEDVQVAEDLDVGGDLNVTGAASTGIITATAIKHAISGNNAGDYGSGAEILYGISDDSVTAGEIYVLRSGVWTLIDADVLSTVSQLAAVATIAAGSGDSSDGMIIKGCVTLNSTYTAGTDSEGALVYASATAGDATLTAPSSSAQFVRILGYSLNVSDKKMFFNPDSTFVKIA
tara:strand:- start:1680 stop:2570 length:891 start_codon:yes stop_codon:yes gene_type:complete